MFYSKCTVLCIVKQQLIFSHYSLSPSFRVEYLLYYEHALLTATSVNMFISRIHNSLRLMFR
jgi:hypothetical protein